MNLFLISPLLIPFLTAIAALLAWDRRRLQRFISVVGATALLGSSLGLLATVWQKGILAAQIGNWPAPFGITLAADLFGAIMVVLAGLMGWAVAIYSLAGIDSQRESFGYHTLLHILLMGVCGAFLTGDLFNMYVWFEVMLIASFVLLELGGEKAQLEGTIKYVTLNLLSSALFLTAVGVLYGVVGTLNMADVAIQLRTVAPAGMVTTLAVLFFLAFGIKAAVFPLFFWLPASYHTPPAPVSAIFAGLLTKVGVYALIRVFTLLFVQEAVTTQKVILLVAGLTMVTGVLGAVAQNEFRRLLSFHIVSQIGYLIMGLGIFTPLGLTGSIFYIGHVIIAKTNLFLVSGVTYRLRGTYELKKLGGLYRAFPFLAILFLIPALSLAGVPPLSGFWAKFILVKAGLETKDYIIVAAALLVGLLTLFSMIKIWTEVFWKDAPLSNETEPVNPTQARGVTSWSPLILPIVGLAILTLVIGLAAEPFLVLAKRAAEQLMNPNEYIHSVLGLAQK
jgi:multicomponent Na+:H+ antiporter subunit D